MWLACPGFNFMKPQVAFQHALAEQLTAIQVATPEVCAGNVEALHAWRVAVRRLRTLLRALPRKRTRAVGAEALQNHWRTWSRKLGPARDADVWHETLRDPIVSKALGASAGGRSFLRAQSRRRRALKLPLRALLRSKEYRRLLIGTQALIEHDLPEELSELDARQLTQSVCQAFSRLLSRARRRAGRLSEASEEAEVHALRRQVRRARYLSELGGNILPTVPPKLRKRLVQVQTDLGVAHDADVQLALLKILPLAVARRVCSRMRRRRTHALRQFRKHWRALARRL